MQTLTSDTNGTAILHKGGVATCFVYFDNGTGTLKFQYCHIDLDNTVSGNWIDTGVSFTASGLQNVTLPYGYLRPVLSGSGGSPSIRADAQGCLGRSAPEV
jgi:hypothetical protein